MKHVPMEIPYGSADESAGLRTMRFTKTQAAFPTEVRVFWGWSDGGAWKGPEQPRLTFAGRRALYKLYVLREKAPDDTRVEDDPCVLFMKELLPELDASLRVPR